MNIFTVEKKKLFEIEPKKEGNYLKFKNESNTQSFRLTLNFKISQNEKAVIIYAESILHNNSGILFDIKSKNKNKSKKTKTQLCFRINDNLFLMSSKISNSVKDSYFMLLNNIFQSKKIKLQEVMEASPYYKLIMNSIFEINNNNKIIINDSYEEGLNKEKSEDLKTNRNDYIKKYKNNYVIYSICVIIINIIIGYICTCYGGVFPNSYTYFIYGFLFSFIMSIIICIFLCFIIVILYKIGKAKNNFCTLSAYITLSKLY